MLRAPPLVGPTPARTSNNHDLLLLSAQLGAGAGRCTRALVAGARVSDIYPSTDEGENSPSAPRRWMRMLLSSGIRLHARWTSSEQTVTAPPPPRSPAAPPPPRSPAPPTRSPLPARSPQRDGAPVGARRALFTARVAAAPASSTLWPLFARWCSRRSSRRRARSLRLDASSLGRSDPLQQQLSMANQRLHKKDLRLTGAGGGATRRRRRRGRMSRPRRWRTPWRRAWKPWWSYASKEQGSSP